MRHYHAIAERCPGPAGFSPSRAARATRLRTAPSRSSPRLRTGLRLRDLDVAGRGRAAHLAAAVSKAAAGV